MVVLSRAAPGAAAGGPQDFSPTCGCTGNGAAVIYLPVPTLAVQSAYCRGAQRAAGLEQGRLAGHPSPTLRPCPSGSAETVDDLVVDVPGLAPDSSSFAQPTTASRPSPPPHAPMVPTPTPSGAEDAATVAATALVVGEANSGAWSTTVLGLDAWNVAAMPGGAITGGPELFALASRDTVLSRVHLGRAVQVLAMD